ncbi:MAG: butyrate kinase [Oscillospiraceae bacterium]|jgi:butyrate kinase
MLIFAINPGSTSTKLALFRDEELLWRTETHHEPEKLTGLRMVDQLEFRTEGIRKTLKEMKVDPASFDIIVCRGGNMPYIKGGAYKVNQHMLNVNTYAPMHEHAANLACMIGDAIGRPLGIPVIIYDGTGVDEMDEIAKITGMPEVTIMPANHVLNSRMVCRMTAKKLGKRFEDCGFIVVHMGGGITITAYKDGKLIDCVMADQGPMSPERSGRIQPTRMLDLCYSGERTKAEMRKYIRGGSGILAHLGTQNMKEVFERIESGDEHARKIVYAMAYQIAKGIGEMAVVLRGKIDSIILTGGLARNEDFCGWISEMAGFLGRFERVPGEYEMEALAEGARRVLSGQEEAKTYDLPPYGFKTVDEFYAAFPQAKREF